MRRNILVSAGEASGDLYAALVVEELRRAWPDARFFGCTGPRLRAAGVETIVDSASLAVVGLLEVVGHLPRIYREYRKLLAAAAERQPDLAILADSPDFHLRVARQLHARNIPGGLSGGPAGLGVAKGTYPHASGASFATCSAFSLSRRNSLPIMELRRPISAIPWSGGYAPRYRGRHFLGNTDSIPPVHW